MDPSALWGDEAFTARLAEVQWMAALPVLLHLNERATGNPARDWLSEWAPQFFYGTNLRLLVLGCGDGWLERALAERHDAIARIDACDFAADAVARAKASAHPKIEYSVVDLNRDTLATNAYDVVIAHQVLHHIENLEYAFDQIEQSLKPEGVFIVNEYVGPKRFQYSDDVDAIINDMLGALPPRLRRSTLTGKTYERKLRPTIEEMIANDPSEAVRSDELQPMIEQRFSIIDRRNLGGTIAQHLLYDIILNFAFDDSVARSALEMICAFDGMLVDRGIVPNDFVLLAARHRDDCAMVTETAPRERSLEQLASFANDFYRPILNGKQRAGKPHPELTPLLGVMQRAILRAR